MDEVWWIYGNKWYVLNKTEVRQPLDGDDGVTAVFIGRCCHDDDFDFYRVAIVLGSRRRILGTFANKKMALDYYNRLIEAIEILGEGEEI